MSLTHPRTPIVPLPAFRPILEGDVNSVNVARPLDPFVATRLATLAQRSHFSCAARIDCAEPDISPLLTAVDDEVAKRFLAKDISHLASQLGSLLDQRHVHARFYVSRSSGCRKIHADHVSLRLICTYAGPGTDWLPDADLIRERLGPSVLDFDSFNRSVIRNGGALRRCEPGDVLLLKGSAHPGNAGQKENDRAEGI